MELILFLALLACLGYFVSVDLKRKKCEVALIQELLLVLSGLKICTVKESVPNEEEMEKDLEE